MRSTFPTFLIALIALTSTAVGQKSPEALRSGHGYSLSSAAFSPDSRFLATGDQAGTLVVWDLKAAKPLYRIEDTEAEGFDLPAFSPDGKILAAVVGDVDTGDAPMAEEIRLWNAATGKLIGSLEGEFSKVDKLTFSPDSGTLVAEVDLNNTAAWDVATLKRKPLVLKGSGPYAFDPAGKRIAFASGGGRTLVIADAFTGRTLRTIPGFTFLCSVAFDPTGKTIAVNDEAKDPRTRRSGIWLKAFNAATGRRILGFDSVDMHPPVAFAEGGKALIGLQFERNFAAEPGETTRIGALFDAATGRKRKDLVVDFPINAFGMAFSSDGRLLAVRSSSSVNNTLLESEVLVIDVAKGTQTARLRGYRRSVNSLAFSSDGKELITTHPDSRIIRWDADRWLPISELLVEKFESQDSHINILPDRRTFTFRNITNVYDISTGERANEEFDEKYFQTRVAVNHAGNLMAASSTSPGKLAFYTLPKVAVRNEIKSPVTRQELESLPFALDADGERLAFIKDSVLWVLNTRDGRELSRFDLPEGREGDIAFSPDGRLIGMTRSEAASTDSEWTLSVIEAASGKKVLAAPVRVEGFAFTTDSSGVLTVNWLNELAVLRTTGKPEPIDPSTSVRRLNEPVRFGVHPTKPLVALGTEFGVQVFDLRDGKQIARLR